ncbi:MAG: serine/threonine-protein kinase [Pseudomonadota bacterium]
MTGVGEGARPGDLFRVGDEVNNTYLIERVLGRGGTSQVYAARNAVTDRLVALKAFRTEFSSKDDYRELIRREEAMRDVVHPAVVRYTDVGRTADGVVYLVMDFIDGPSLDKVLRGGPMPVRDLLVIGRSVAGGLAAAHAARIVHRDLSPDNIVLRDDKPEQATIIDFGIARDTSPGAATVFGDVFAGKLEYAAPEQFEGRVDERSDLYALGTSLLAAARGRIPEAPPNQIKAFEERSRPPDLDDVPEPLRRVLSRLMEPMPERRAQSAEEAARIFAAALEEPVSIAEPPSRERGTRGAQPTKPRPRRRGGVLAASVVVLAALGGLGFWQQDAIRDLIDPPPAIAPYVMQIERLPDGRLSAEGHLPTREGLARFRDHLTGLGARAEATGLARGTGAPSETYAADLEALIGSLDGLDDWRLTLTDRDLALTGLAPDAEGRASVTSALEAAVSSRGYRLSRTDIAVGPRVLAPDRLETAFGAIMPCGTPRLDVPAAGHWQLGERVTANARVANREDADALRQRLEALAGDRPVELGVKLLNPSVCRVLALLPDADTGAVSIWLGEGGDGQQNLTGIYHVGDNPLIDVLLPETSVDRHLHVVAVDVSDTVFNLVPNIHRTENRTGAMGAEDGGVRRIRVAYRLEERLEDPSVIAFEINPEFGRSLVIAFVSDQPLFDEIRPISESSAAFADALEARLARPDARIDTATRLIDSR